MINEKKHEKTLLHCVLVFNEDWSMFFVTCTYNNANWATEKIYKKWSIQETNLCEAHKVLQSNSTQTIEHIQECLRYFYETTKHFSNFMNRSDVNLENQIAM